MRTTASAVGVLLSLEGNSFASQVLYIQENHIAFDLLIALILQSDTYYQLYVNIEWNFEFDI